MASTGQGILGNNMFAYCGNNPVINFDSLGLAFFPCTVRFSDGGGSSAPSQEDEETKYSGTFSIGATGNIGVGPWIWGGQIFITVDANGYAAVQYGSFGGMYAGPNSDKFSASMNPFAMVTNAPSYKGLEGKGFQTDMSYAPYSVDYVGMLDESGEQILYQGLAVGYGATSPDVHVTWGVTGTWYAIEFDWNLFYQVTQY